MESFILCLYLTALIAKLNYFFPGKRFTDKMLVSKPPARTLTVTARGLGITIQ